MSILSKRLAIGTDLGYSTLDGAIDDSQTAITVASGAPFPELSSGANRRRFIPAVICPADGPENLTFGDLQSGEHIVIMDHAAASTTLTVIRGDSPISHPSGSLIMIMPTAQVWDSLYAALSSLEAVLAASIGAGPGADAAILDYGPTARGSFAATQSGTPDMNVQIAAGIGAYGPEVFEGAATSVAFTAPAMSTRVDLICWSLDANALVIVAGTEGAGAPAVPARHVDLWEVSIDVGQTAILNADLTDRREFA